MNRPNILFLMVDCLRADVVLDRARYPSVPTMDELAAGGAVFPTCIAAATTTTPSVATMLTGLPPAGHGIRSLLGYKLRPQVRTLAEELRAAGYYTSAEVTGPLFTATELDRGFDHYRRRERDAYLDTPWGAELRASLRERRMLEPWFLFLHVWELHWPRRTSEAFDSPRYGSSRYQRAVAHVDRLLGELLDCLDRDSTFVVLTGDHGEGIAGAIDQTSAAVQLGMLWGYRITRRLPLQAKKRILTLAKRAVLVGRGAKASATEAGGARREVAGHASLCVYDYLARVPLLLNGAGVVPPRKVASQVRHLDIAPTLLEVAGARPRQEWAPSLLPLARGLEQEDRPAVTEALQTMLHDPVRRLVGFRTGQYKLIFAPDNPGVADELYDVRADPLELENLAPSQPELVRQLRARLEREPTSSTGDEARMTAEEQAVLRRRLEQLGYLE
jgi:arylsulfatase A-like enzyme